MSKNIVRGALVAGVIALASATTPASAQTHLGQLQCNVSNDVGVFYLGLRQIGCIFTSTYGYKQAYFGGVGGIAARDYVGPGYMTFDVVGVAPVASLEATYSVSLQTAIGGETSRTVLQGGDAGVALIATGAWPGFVTPTIVLSFDRVARATSAVRLGPASERIP